jgi:hypothetical protein
MSGKIRRVGNVRLPDDQRPAWSVASPNSIPHRAGVPPEQDMCEARAPTITEEHMVAREPGIRRKHSGNTPQRGRKPKIKAVLPQETNMAISLPGKDEPTKTVFNMRIPTRLLNHYRDSGPNTSARIIAVLEMFVREGGTFVEGD